MAIRKIVTLEDDLDGGEATSTVPFGLDGVHYEIDLNAANADKLRTFLRPFVEAGRRTGGRQRFPLDGTPTKSRKRAGVRRSNARGASTAGQPSRSSLVREWAKANGMSVNERGRIPADIEAAYDKAQAGAARAS